MEIGINTNNECGKSYKEICDNIKKVGFKNVMIAFKIGEEEEQIKYALNLGLNIPYVHLDNGFTNNLWVKGAAHDYWLNLIKAEIDLCGKYGIKIAVIHATVGDPNCVVISPNDFALQTFKDLVDYAQYKDVKIALENVDANGLNHFKFLLDNIKSDNLGFCYDVGHQNLYARNLNLIDLYGDRLLAIHLHDNLGDYQLGDDYTRDLHYIPFDGNVDYEKVIKGLKQTQYNNVIMLEVHKNPLGTPKLYQNLSATDFLQKAKQSAEKIRDLLAN